MTLDEPVIDVRQLEAWYGRRRVLHGIDFRVMPGEIRGCVGCQFQHHHAHEPTSWPFDLNTARSSVGTNSKLGSPWEDAGT